MLGTTSRRKANERRDDVASQQISGLGEYEDFSYRRSVDPFGVPRRLRIQPDRSLGVSARAFRVGLDEQYDFSPLRNLGTLARTQLLE
jgi:hypothetical protein